MKSKQKQLCRIQDIAKFDPENIGRDFLFSTINYVDTSSVTEGKLDRIQTLSLDDAPSRAKRLVKENDIIISTVRPNLKHYYLVKNPPENLIVSTGFVVIRSTDVDPHYLYYFLTTPSFIEYLSGVASSHTSTYPSFPPDIIKNTEINLPLLHEQQKIGKILYDLDTKIENLQKQNKILEQIAQAIFKSWFVDFDGVTKFYDTELGLIPECWTVGSLHDLSEITSGKRPQSINKMKNNSYDIPVYGASGTMGFTDESLYENRLILTGRVGTVGLIQYVAEKCFPSDNTLVIIPKNSYFFNYVFDILSSTNFRCIIKGSTQPLITQTDLKDISCVIPDNDILKKFENISNHLRMFIKLNEKSINNLVQVRDLLLPKLISGEIRV